MSGWPDGLDVAPIREWPGALTQTRTVSSFRKPGFWRDGRWHPPAPMPLSSTLAELDRELRAVDARDVELLVAIDPGAFRLDGRPRAGAKAHHPGIILSFELPGIGRLSYPCDRFTRWEDNLRAVVLGLEALRKVDRYGVTRHGEQYRGFLAIEAGATAAPAGFRNADEAEAFIAQIAGTRTEGRVIAAVVRLAKRASHPDHGGDASVFQRVMLAEAKLRADGRV